MNLQWFLTIASLIAAVAALLWARHATKRLERLSQSYWELRYEHGQLASRLSRLESPDGHDDVKAAGGPQQVNFVPLSSLKK